MADKEKNHYSPVLANKHWCDETSHYWAYEKNLHKRRVEGKKKGKEQWGRLKRLYRPEVETALDLELETKVEPIYAALLRGAELAASDAVIWAQFLRSQFVRTPTFIRYENFAKERHGIENQPPCDRVGCEDCQDLGCVLNRDWMLLVAHPDDYFVRTDNPVHCIGFLEDPSTVLYYPLHPKICFVACSMPGEWAFMGPRKATHPLPAFQLEKGDAFLLDFHFAKAADNSLILHPSHRGLISETMFTDVLGLYPQMPFDLHRLDQGPKESLMKSLRMVMSMADGRTRETAYPPFSCAETAPRYLPRSARVSE